MNDAPPGLVVAQHDGEREERSVYIPICLLFGLGARYKNITLKGVREVLTDMGWGR